MTIDAKQIRKFHRFIAIVFSVSTLVAAGSGVIHNVMSRTQAPPPKARPSAKIDASLIKVSIPEAYSKLAVKAEGFDAVSVRSISGLPWYQFMIHESEKPFYVNAQNGEMDENADERYALDIASAYLPGKKVEKTAFLKEYDSEYINIFRILPVYRFDVNDALHTRVYVSTMTGSVTRFTDDRKQREAWFFSNFHKLMFIKNKDVRDAVLTFTTAGIFIAALSGIFLFISTRKR